MHEKYLKEEFNSFKNDCSIFSLINEFVIDGFCYCDLENLSKVYFSSQFWNVLGYDNGTNNPPVKEWNEIIFQEDILKIKEAIKLNLKNPDNIINLVLRFKHKNGSKVWLRFGGKIIKNSQGIAIRLLGFYIDITDSKKKEERINRISNEYEMFFNSAQNAMFLIKIVGKNEFRYIRTNKYHQNKTKIKAEDIQNKTPIELLGEETGRELIKNYQKCIDEGKAITYEETLEISGESHIWLTTLTPIKEGGKYKYIMGSAIDLTMQKSFKMNANYDDLTGLPNRRFFIESVNQIILEHQYNNKSFAFLFIDLDNFKHINDRYGHNYGDKVLKETANRLARTLRETDLVARFGGDEFTVVLKDTNSKEVIKKITAKLLNQINKSILIDNIICSVGASIGVAMFPDDAQDFDELVKKSDKAMYSVKENGKGGCYFYSLK